MMKNGKPPAPKGEWLNTIIHHLLSFQLFGSIIPFPRTFLNLERAQDSLGRCLSSYRISFLLIATPL